jgi:OOP family OmpA-OmpF porin
MNLELSQLRAESVKTALLTRRTLVRNLTSKGYGEAHPIADNKTEQGREINRRIEFNLIVNNAISIGTKESDTKIGQD